MVDLAKVIKKIEEYLRNEHDGFCLVRSTFLWNVRKLLKEQQPRVLSYKEVMESDFVFIELYTDERDGVEPEFIRAIPLFISYSQPDFVTQYEICGHGTREEYMHTWRCWTDRPTDEQRKVEPWKDGDGE